MGTQSVVCSLLLLSGILSLDCSTENDFVLANCGCTGVIVHLRYYNKNMTDKVASQTTFISNISRS